MNAFIAFDVSMSKWLAYAFAMMLAKPVYALIIVGVATVLLGFFVGRMWGKAWNKSWNLGGARFWGVGALSLFAGLCLGGVNSLYGGELFNTKVGAAMKLIDGLTSNEVTEDARETLPVLRKIQELAADPEEKLQLAADPTKILIPLDELLVSTYFTTLTVLWTLFALSVALLFGSVAYYAYKDIKLVAPY